MAEENNNNENEYNFVALLIVVIVLLILKQCYDYYKKITKSHHEVYFVMMGEPECCNPNDRNTNPGNKCKKYCMGKLLKKILNRINEAKSCICIAMYNFSNHRIADAVLRAHRRGVKVRIITDKSMCETGENKTQAKRLKDAGKEMFKLITEYFRFLFQLMNEDQKYVENRLFFIAQEFPCEYRAKKRNWCTTNSV